MKFIKNYTVSPKVQKEVSEVLALGKEKYKLLEGIVMVRELSKEEYEYVTSDDLKDGDNR
jgi:hypothetical protein